MSGRVELGRRYLRLRWPGTALGALAALAVGLWLFTHRPAQLLLAAALLAAVAIDAAVAWSATGEIEPRVSGPTDLVAGQPTVWTLQLDGVRRPVVVTPCRFPRADQVRVETDRAGLVTFPALARGVAHSLLLDVTATGVAGLFEAGRRVRVGMAAPLFVGPPPLPHGIAWARPRAVTFGLAPTAPVGDDLFRSVRPYVPGDPRRSVHWKATAHHGQLMVRESDGTGVVAVRVVVHLPGPGAVADVTAARAAFIAEEALRRGWVVHVVTMAPVELPIEPPVALRSPFGPPPPMPLAGPVTLAVSDCRVRTPRDVQRTLAIASAGAPPVGRSPGLTCLVTPDETEWR